MIIANNMQHQVLNLVLNKSSCNCLYKQLGWCLPSLVKLFQKQYPSCPNFFLDRFIRKIMENQENLWLVVIVSIQLQSRHNNSEYLRQPSKLPLQATSYTWKKYKSLNHVTKMHCILFTFCEIWKNINLLCGFEGFIDRYGKADW
jgi:hypothetical protein